MMKNWKGKTMQRLDPHPMEGHPTPQYSQAKLTPQQRDQITKRYQDGEPATTLAAEYGVSTRLIRDTAGARQPGTRRKR